MSDERRALGLCVTPPSSAERRVAAMDGAPGHEAFAGLSACAAEPFSGSDR